MPTPALAPVERPLLAELEFAVAAVVEELELRTEVAESVEKREYVEVVEPFPEAKNGTSQPSTLRERMVEPPTPKHWFSFVPVASSLQYWSE